MRAAAFRMVHIDCLLIVEATLLEDGAVQLGTTREVYAAELDEC